MEVPETEAQVMEASHTSLGVTALAVPEMKVEVAAVAVAGSGRGARTRR